MNNLLRTLILGGFLMMVFAACQNDETYVEPAQDDLLSIEETLVSLTEASEAESAKEDPNARFFGRKKRPTFRTLIVALARTRLLGDVLRGELTVLAPTDIAFKALGITPRNVKDVPNLKEILLYHVIDGKVRSTDLTEGYVPTANGASVRVSLDGGVFFNDSEVVKADIHTRRGVIHVIDGVLLPPTLLGLVEGNENFSILEAALKKAELDVVLDGPDANSTVFAPTNAAFAALLAELGLTTDQLLNSSILEDVLLYHVILGQQVFSSDLSQGLEATMANGEKITFDLTGAPIIIDELGREVPLNTGLLDIRATNGVVHVIDRVLASQAVLPLVP